MKFLNTLRCDRRGGYYPPETFRFLSFPSECSAFVIERLQAANSRPYGSISANTHLAFPDRPQTTAIRGMVRSSLTRQRPTLCKSRALYFGAASLPLNRSLSSRQGAVQSTGQPHLGGFESPALHQQKRPPDGGSFLLAEDEGFEPPRTESESGVLPLH